MRRLGLWVLGTAALLGGCASEPNHFDALPDDVCAKQHHETTSDGHDVVVCEALYAAAPFVHLPKAEQGRAFAGIVGTEFVTVDGATAGSTMDDAELKRHGVALYELNLDGGKLNDFAPVILFDEALFFAPLLGRSFEGTISPATGEGRWAFDPSLPVQVAVQAQPLDHPSDGTSLEAEVTLSNLDTPVTASDGSCMPSLTSYGSDAPFAAGSKVDVRLSRVPSMHNFGDDHLVLTLTIDGAPAGTLMGSWFTSPLDLVHGALAPSGAYTGIGHGTPGYIPSITLEPAAVAGGAACAP